jgi:hypothetical protein
MLREERELRVFDIRVVRMFEYKGDAAIGE